MKHIFNICLYALLAMCACYYHDTFGMVMMMFGCSYTADIIEAVLEVIRKRTT